MADLCTPNEYVVEHTSHLTASAPSIIPRKLTVVASSFYDERRNQRYVVLSELALQS